RDHRPRFRLLHATDKSPVRFERVCIRDGHAVAWEELVRGYEYQKGHFVVLSREDFKAAAVEKTRTIDIIDFVTTDESDDRFFETPYYLVPAKGGEHAYALLREALRESGRTGIAKFILRDAQHLAAVEVIGGAIVLSVMRFSDELVDAGQFEFPSEKGLRDNERQLARALVNSLAAEWSPDKYTDQYRENLLRLIKAKLKGRHVELESGEEPREANVVSLMERLRASLAQSGGRTGKRARHAAEPRSQAAHRRSKAVGKKKPRSAA